MLKRSHDCSLSVSVGFGRQQLGLQSILATTLSSVQSNCHVKIETLHFMRIDFITSFTTTPKHKVLSQISSLLCASRLVKKFKNLQITFDASLSYKPVG